MPPEPFRYLGTPGTWVSRETVVPLSVEPVEVQAARSPDKIVVKL